MSRRINKTRTMECFDGLSIIDLNKTCRVCLCVTESGNRISLFSKSNIESLEYRLLLIKCVSTEVSGNDGLPDAICGKCEIDLRTSYEFISRFQESNEKLNHILNQIQFLDSQTFYKDRDITWSPATTECDILFSLDETTDIKYEDQLEKNIKIEENVFENISLDINTYVTKKRNKNVLLVTNKNNKIKKEKCQRFQCFGCEKKFATKSALNTHIKKNHSEKKEYICEKCGKQFFDRSSVTQHSKIHNEELSFVCSHCPKMFRSSANLHRHESSHSELRPFSCTFCSKSFVMKDYLDQHLQVHSDIKRFKCEICGKELKTWNGLKSHKLVHSNERPFACDMCETYFTSKPGLRQHIHSHHQSNKAQLQSPGGRCTLCQKEFPDLTEHSKVHLKELFECDICKQSFKKKDALQLHVVQAHKEGCPIADVAKA